MRKLKTNNCISKQAAALIQDNVYDSLCIISFYACQHSKLQAWGQFMVMYYSPNLLTWNSRVHTVKILLLMEQYEIKIFIIISVIMTYFCDYDLWDTVINLRWWIYYKLMELQTVLSLTQVLISMGGINIIWFFIFPVSHP